MSIMQSPLLFFKSHPVLGKALRLLGGLLALLFLIVLYVAVVGISLDASGKRGEVAGMLTQTLGREVRFEGPLQLEISAQPKLRLGGLHIANAAGFGGGEFASLGEVRLAINLWALLRLRLQIEELAGSGVHVRLQMKKNGSSNWVFNPSGAQQAAAQPTPTGEGDSKALGELLSLLDIKRVALDKLEVEFIGSNAQSHFFELESLVAHFPAGQPLALTLHGKVEKIYPYKLDLTGGNIADLVRLDQPWPVDLKLEFMSSRLSLNGSVSANTGTINFGIGTENLAEFERLLQTKLPAVGVTGIAGTLKFSPKKIALENLSGVMGKTTLVGALNVDYGGARPKIQGELDFPVLDLRPFMGGQPAVRDDAPPKSLAEVYREIAQASFSLKALDSADADLTLRVGQWLSLPGNVHDAMLRVKLAQGRLTVPMQISAADVALSGSASVDSSVEPPRLKLALGTHHSSLGNLGKLLLGMPDVRGQLERFDLRIAARGDSGAELMDSLDVRLNVAHGKLSYGNAAGGHPVQFSLENFEVILPAGKPLRGEMHGALLDKTFSATLSGGSLPDIMREADVPIDFALQAGSAKVKVHAQLQPPGEETGSAATFELTAPHSGEIAAWLGLKSGADAPVSLQGNFNTDNDSWHLSDFALKLGHSVLSADVLRIVENGKPLVKLQLGSELIDMVELQTLLPEAPTKAPAKHEPVSASMIDIPILPQGISLADADIVVRLKHIRTATPFAVRDVRFDGRIRDGMMSASPFAANVAESNFSGAILLDLRTQQPSAGLWLAADEVNIGSILNKLDIARNIEADVDHMRLHLDLHASRLGQLLAQSDMAINFDTGLLTLNNADGGKMRIALDSGELKSAAGAPVRLDLLGSLDKVPVSISVETAKAVDLVNPALSIPFKLIVSSSGAAIQLAGDIDRPFSQTDIELALNMSGTRVDNLNALAHTSLPPWGPWTASGKFHMTGKGYEVSALSLQVGSSLLGGHGKFDTQTVPLRIDVELTAPAIQLDDFKFGDWTPEKNKPDAKPQAKGNKRKAADDAQQMLSREVLQRQNAYLAVRVDKVLSGKDELGSGKLEARLENGNADIGPVVVNTPGGAAMLRLKYEPGEKDVAVNLRTEVKRFDYGVLARRLDPKSEMRGIFSLDVDVSARAQHLSELLRYGKGYIDFAVWPENMKSGLLDVWAVNVLMALLPVVDASNESKVNCAVGRFVLKDGKLSDKTIFIDTSRMRVTGKGGVDFATDEIKLYVQPRAKTPQFLSFALPISVSGNFDEFHIGVRAADVLEMVGQMVTSVVWVPLQSLFGKATPEDGRDVCGAGEFEVVL